MRFRLGIVGTGIAARELHWPALQRLQDRFEIVALANRTRAKAESSTELIGGRPRITSDYRELLSWPEVQVVDQTAWRLEPEHVGGYLSDGGVHQTAALQVLAGPVASVQGMVTTFDPDRDPTASSPSGVGRISHGPALTGGV